MPDTFGFTGALPQIMKGCRVDFFATQKLLRADPECEPFPYNLFWWEGIDGSRVLTHIFKKNNAAFSPADMVGRWEKDRNQEEEISESLQSPAKNSACRSAPSASRTFFFISACAV